MIQTCYLALFITVLLSGIESKDGESPSTLERGATMGHNANIAANPKENILKVDDVSYSFDSSPLVNSNPELSTQVAFKYLKYIEKVLKSDSASCSSGNPCDLSRYSSCTCISPASYSDDGRGNCNVGATKIDLQVWCYVNPNYGDPPTVCPDAKPSTSKPGYYWSRLACITK